MKIRASVLSRKQVRPNVFRAGVLLPIAQQIYSLCQSTITLLLNILPLVLDQECSSK